MADNSNTNMLTDTRSSLPPPRLSSFSPPRIAPLISSIQPLLLSLNYRILPLLQPAIAHLLFSRVTSPLLEIRHLALR
ncbi:hypothetical protein Ancab_002512 [Ancistrocladus abbreviatus]